MSKSHSNGDLTVRHQTNGGLVRLPHDYVTDHVELGYATTTALAQGRTVDTAHVLINTSVTRESSTSPPPAAATTPSSTSPTRT